MSPRSLIRDSLVWAGVLLLVPVWIWPWLERWLRLGESLFAGSSELFSLIPGKPGIFARRSFYRMTLDVFATDCHIGFGTTFAHPEVQIGRGVYIGNRCTIGRAIIEEHATIGSNVDLLSGRRQHRFDQLHAPIQNQGGKFLPVRIGRNCWIGNSAVIMAHVGTDCVVGAGSVVVHDLPARAVAVGNPAVVKKLRGVSEAAA